MDKDIYKLQIHERANDNNWSVTRVAGGWIYQNKYGNLFVPFNNEFQNKKQ